MGNVLEYVKEDNIAIFTLNRPEVFNAQNLELLRGLGAALKDFRDDPNLRVGIVTGAGEKAFCAGADIKETLFYMKENRGRYWSFPETMMKGMDLYKPLIAAINGLALGGGMEIALACDIRIASEKARMGLPEVKLGIIPGGGGTQRLPRMIPWCHAAGMAFTGQHFDAREACRMGLVNEVVPPDQVMVRAREWAARICECSPLAVQAAKEAMVRGSNMTLEDGLRLEDALESFLLVTDDFVEGTSAFIEKRKPQWKGK